MTAGLYFHLPLPCLRTVPSRSTIGVDGSVSIDGLNVGMDDLALQIPLHQVLTPSDWSLDLQGLAVGFNSGPVEISGGLRKNPGPPIEYDGMLSAQVAGIGLTVVGSYSRPSDAQGGYTSLFMFVSLPIPLGGPPFAFITGYDTQSIDARFAQIPIIQKPIARDVLQTVLTTRTRPGPPSKRSTRAR